MSKTLIDISHLTLSYDGGKNTLVKDISFSISEGKILSIIGKNGTGKSSLLKVIAGVEKPYSGNIKKYTSKISYIPQKLHMDSSFPLTVGEFFSIFHGSIDSKDQEYLLALFGIQSLKARNIHTLSGGEFQKVLIVNALLCHPDILLLDEPTSGIDIIGEEQFYKNISLLREKFPKIALILVSHNLHLVYKNSDRVICLHDNNFCCHGTPVEVQENLDVQKIFGDYVRPYEHHPHAHHHHTQ